MKPSRLQIRLMEQRREVQQRCCYDMHERITAQVEENTKMELKKEALARLEIVEEVVLDCCNHPQNGPTNCMSIVRTNDGFALVGDDGHVEELSNEQMEQLVHSGGEMLDHVD